METIISLFKNRIVQGITIVLIVVAALVIRKVVTPTFAENLQYLCGGQAQVEFESKVVSRNIAFDALRVSTPAVGIDVENAKKLVVNLCEQAKLLDEEMKLRLAIDADADTDDIEKAMANIRQRFNNLVDDQVAMYIERQEILDLYKVVVTLPKYNKAQNQALKACESALEKGEWQKAKSECENAQKLAVPPTPVPSPTAITTPVILPPTQQPTPVQ